MLRREGKLVWYPGVLQNVQPTKKQPHDPSRKNTEPQPWASVSHDGAAEEVDLPRWKMDKRRPGVPGRRRGPESWQPPRKLLVFRRTGEHVSTYEILESKLFPLGWERDTECEGTIRRYFLQEKGPYPRVLCLPNVEFRNLKAIHLYNIVVQTHTLFVVQDIVVRSYTRRPGSIMAIGSVYGDRPRSISSLRVSVSRIMPRGAPSAPTSSRTRSPRDNNSNLYGSFSARGGPTPRLSAIPRTSGFHVSLVPRVSQLRRRS